MRFFKLAVALGVVGLASLTSSAFAGIDLVNTGSVSGDSFREDFTASSTSSGTNTNGYTFDNIRVYKGGAVTFTTTDATYNISSPQDFEDNGSGNTSGNHDGIAGFIYDGGGANSWAQATFSTTYMTATGGAVAPTHSLSFSLWFAGDETDGGHAYIEFWNGSTFQTGWEYKVKTGSTIPDGSRGVELHNYSTAVPLPSAAWSGLALLAGLGGYLVRRRRTHNSLLS